LSFHRALVLIIIIIILVIISSFSVNATRPQHSSSSRIMSTQAHKANESLDLTGKTAAIAGGSQGIGAGTAIRFAQAGANVIVVGRSKERLEKVVAEARKAAKSVDQKFDYVSVDLSLVSGVKTAAKEIEAKSNGKVDYLVRSHPGTNHVPFLSSIESERAT
jgi:phosphoglycerate dehydrogenase-like enzyme